MKHSRIIFGICIFACNSSNEDISGFTSEGKTTSSDSTNATTTEVITTDVTTEVITTEVVTTEITITDSTIGTTEISDTELIKEDAGPNCECDDDPNCNNCIEHDRLIFVSSNQYQGNFGSMPGLDDKCNQLALKAGLLINNKKRFSTWISTNKINAKDRFYHSSGRYVLVNGTVVANNWEDLVDGSLQHPINIDENGSEIYTAVWTGTNPDGKKNQETTLCNDWTSSDFLIESTYGYSVKNDGQWTNVIDGTSPTTCAEAFSIYCIEFE